MTDDYRAAVRDCIRAIRAEGRRAKQAAFRPRIGEFVDHLVEAVEMATDVTEYDHRTAPPKMPQRSTRVGPMIRIGTKAGAGAEHQRRSESAQNGWRKRRAS